MRQEKCKVEKKIIDLTLTLSERLPGTWPGHMQYSHKSWNWFGQDVQAAGCSRSKVEYKTNFVLIDEHTGTHFDAPTHFLPPLNSGLKNAAKLGEMDGEQVDLSKLIGEAAVIDVTLLNGTTGNGISPDITKDFIVSWEEKHGDIKEGEIILFRTGWDKYYVTGAEGNKFLERPVRMKDFPGWPAPGVEAILYLCDKGVTTLGIDSSSMGSVHDGISVHVEGLKRGLVFIEGLANLDKLPIRGSKFMFLPLKVEGSSGFPGRAIAFIKDN